jgi:hypothetical protein
MAVGQGRGRVATWKTTQCVVFLVTLVVHFSFRERACLPYGYGQAAQGPKQHRRHTHHLPSNGHGVKNTRSPCHHRTIGIWAFVSLRLAISCTVEAIQSTSCNRRQWPCSSGL